MIETRPVQVRNSLTHSNTNQWPITGSTQCGSNNWPNAVTRVRNSPMNPNATNQCRTPTWLHCSIRVWPRVSLASVAERRPGLSVRPAGWPSLMTDTMCPIVLPNSATPTAVTASETTMARICIPAMLLVGYP